MSAVNLGTGGLEQIGVWKFQGPKFILEKDILLRQTNAIGNTYFSEYIEWQGEAREQLLFAHPATREYLKQNANIKLVTHSLFHRFLVDSSLGDRIRIEVTTREIHDYSLVLVFRYYDLKKNMQIGEGWQKICYSDKNTKNLCRIPQLILDLTEPLREN